MMTRITTLALILCGLAVAQDPPQYGTPFAGVPDPRDASIYQVNIRAFSGSGDLKGVTDRLDKIKALGVNIVYLMPIYPVGVLKSSNSPYCVRNYKEVNPEFGNLEDLRSLIREAHSRGMAVILDWVANHTAWDHPWITAHPDWYEHEANGAIKTAGVGGHAWPDVAKLDLTQAGARKAMIEAMRYWILAANCDGYRFDYAAGPPIGFWAEANLGLRSIPNHKLILYAEGSNTANFKVFDFNHGFSFYDAMKQMFGTQQAPATRVDAENQDKYRDAGDSNQLVRYTTNHDVNGWDGPPAGIFGGQTGSMAAFAIVALNRGVPMIYNGQEVALKYRLSFPFTGENIDWNGDQSVTDEYVRILRFRNGSEAIRRGKPKSFGNNDVCAFLKSSGKDSAVVLVNIRNRTVSFSLPPELRNTAWTDAFDGSALRFGAGIELKPFEYRAGKAAVATSLVNAGSSPRVTGTDSRGLRISGSRLLLSGFSAGETFHISDVGGKIKVGSKMAGEPGSMDVAALPHGVYLLQARSVEGRVSWARKFLK